MNKRKHIYAPGGDENGNIHNQIQIEFTLEMEIETKLEVFIADYMIHTLHKNKWTGREIILKYLQMTINNRLLSNNNNNNKITIAT